jgi:hypothetical protein
MIMCEWDAPEGHSGQCVAYTCMLSYPIDVFHLSVVKTPLFTCPTSTVGFHSTVSESFYRLCRICTSHFRRCHVSGVTIIGCVVYQSIVHPVERTKGEGNTCLQVWARSQFGLLERKPGTLSALWCTPLSNINRFTLIEDTLPHFNVCQLIAVRVLTVTVTGTF